MNFKYRPEIDGLRAIAVFSVVFYHANFSFYINGISYKFFKGGFLGVDIFFVISGYLITFLILENAKKNKFTFKDFYERRARRLLPTLFLVITFSLIFGWIYMLPNQLKNLSGSSLSSLFFVSNFWFLLKESYFADISSLKPLLHTWSLSIEEQFYLIFPPFLYFLYKKKIKNLKLIFAFIILGSLTLATFGSYYFPESNFYILPTRIWELLVGAILAHHHFETKNKKRIKGINFFMPLGFVLIFSSFFLFNNNTLHPSIFTSFTILGTFLIIFFYNESSYVKKILSNKIMVGSGLISYSLYLWHFPIFAFQKIKSQNVSDFDKVEAILLAIFISVMSYLFIEKPFRNRKLILKNYFYIIILTYFIVLLISCFYIYKKNGSPQRFSAHNLSLIEFNYDYSKAYQVGKCHIKLQSSNTKNLFKNCTTNKSATNKKQIYLWGDSLAAHLYPGIEKKYKGEFNIWQKTSDRCKPFFTLVKNKDASACEKINKYIFDEIINLKPDKIFLSGLWSQKDMPYIKETIVELKKNNIKNIYLVGPVPRWRDPLPKLLLKQYRINNNLPAYLYDKNQVNTFKLDIEFDLFAKENFINYLSPIKILCKKNYKCLTKVGKEADAITNWDENHFTEKASIYLLNKFVD
ncbi:acyltransferase [Pelagibacteraceae bacterium]|nr:acyltransferase [Pelagibacteraceae bacterium]